MLIQPEDYAVWDFRYIKIVDPLAFSGFYPLTFNSFIGEVARASDHGKIDLAKHPWPFSATKDCRLAAELCHQPLAFSFTTYENVLLLRSERESYFLFACNTILPTVPLIAFALISLDSDQLFLFLPSAADKAWLSLDIISKFSASFPGEGLQTRAARDEAFRSVTLAQKLHLCTYKNNHLGHYILNDLGPSNDIFHLINGSAGKLILARINPGFLPDDAEDSFIAGELLPNPSILHFTGLFAMKSHIAASKSGLICLHGANVESSLALAVKNYLQKACVCNNMFPLSKENESAFAEIFVISIRVGNRAALNISEVTELCFLSLPRRLQKHSLFLIDGMASQHNASTSNTTASLSMQGEVELAQSIVELITLRGGNAFSLVGMSLLEQLAAMQNATMVLAHISSASVKYLCLLGKPQLLHSASGKRSLPSTGNLWNEGVDIIFGKAYKESEHPVEIFTDISCVTRVVPELSNGLEQLTPRNRSNYVLDAKIVALMFYSLYGELSMETLENPARLRENGDKPRPALR